MSSGSSNTRAGDLIGLMFVARHGGESSLGTVGDLDDRDLALGVIDMQSLILDSRRRQLDGGLRNRWSGRAVEPA